MNLILLVESNPEDRRRLGTWLEQAGYSLMDCPGPSRQDFSCLGIRGKHCALVEIADIAILDGRVLQSGTDVKSATRLLHYYLQSGKPVVLLVDKKSDRPRFESDRVATADRGNRDAILTAVTDLLDVRWVAS